MAGTKVINGQADAQRSQAVQQRHALLTEVHHFILGDLQLQALGRQCVALQRLLNPPDNVAALHPESGHVDRDRADAITGIPPAAQLATGLLQHILVNVGNQAGLARHREELAGGNQAALRMLPAHQCLDTDPATTVEGFLQLIVHAQLATLDGLVQVGFQRQPQPRLLCQILGIEGIAVGASLLGHGHRRVGVLEQLRPICSVCREHRQTNTGTHVHQMARQIKGGLQQLQNALRQLAQLLNPKRSLQQQGELIAAQARQGVAVITQLQKALGNQLQQLVTGIVAQAVVDAFEPVQVDKQQRQLAVLTTGTRHRRVQALGQQQAIGQLGQGVMVGQVVNFFLGALKRTHVSKYRNKVAQLGALVAYRDDVLPLRINLAIFASVPDFPGPPSAAHQLLPHLAVKVAVVTAGRQQVRLATNHFLGSVTGDLAEGIVDVNDVLPGVTDQHALAGAVEHHAGLKQPRLPRDLLADIAQHANQPRGAAFGVAQSTPTGMHPADPVHRPGQAIGNVQAFGGAPQVLHQGRMHGCAILCGQQVLPVSQRRTADRQAE